MPSSLHFHDSTRRKNKGCKPDFIPQLCEQGNESSFSFETIKNLDWPLADVGNLTLLNETQCQDACAWMIAFVLRLIKKARKRKEWIYIVLGLLLELLGRPPPCLLLLDLPPPPPSGPTPTLTSQKINYYHCCLVSKLPLPLVVSLLSAFPDFSTFSLPANFIISALAALAFSQRFKTSATFRYHDSY